jgi:hypothetical protein
MFYTLWLNKTERAYMVQGIKKSLNTKKWILINPIF